MLKIFAKSLAANLGPSLLILVPGALLTFSQRAVYAGYVFIPLTALVLFLFLFMRPSCDRVARLIRACSAVLIILIAHFILVGFSAVNFLYFILYFVASGLGMLIGLMVND